jgi:hypothetical protein
MVYAIDNAPSQSVPLWNCFEYVRTVCVERDFDGIDFGALNLNEHKMLSGDEDMTTPDKPTLKNGGNADADIYVQFTRPVRDCNVGGGPGCETCEMQQVIFDARLGLLEPVDNIPPVDELIDDPATPMDESLTGIGMLPICHTWELDLSILPKKILPVDAVCFGKYDLTVTVKAMDAGTPCEGVPCCNLFVPNCPDNCICEHPGGCVPCTS